jgi:RNA polymerase sigma-70 factor (ECF subfamily)
MELCQELLVESGRDLLQRVLALDESALAEVFDEYYLPLYRYIYHCVHHAETAEDLAAEVFRRLLEQIAEGRGPRRNLKAWLFRVAYNLVVDDSRRQLHRQHAALNEGLSAGKAAVEEQAQHAILAADAHRALDGLTPKQRAVIILKFLVGLENDEVAQVLLLPVGAVKSLQHRGLEAMRRDLSRRPEWSAGGELV